MFLVHHGCIIDLYVLLLKIGNFSKPRAFVRLFHRLCAFISQENSPTLVPANSPGLNNARAFYTLNGVNQDVLSSIQVNDPQTFSLAVGFRTSNASNGRKLMGFEDVQSGTNATASDRCLGIAMDGTLSFGVTEGTAGGSIKLSSSSVVVTDGAWYYGVATFDGVNLNVYVNGNSSAVSSNQLTGGNGAKHFAGWWRVGGYKNCGFGDGFFAGSIALAQVRLRSHYFCGCVVALMQTPPPPPPPPPKKKNK